MVACHLKLGLVCCTILLSYWSIIVLERSHPQQPAIWPCYSMLTSPFLVNSNSKNMLFVSTFRFLQTSRFRCTDSRTSRVWFLSFKSFSTHALKVQRKMSRNFLDWFSHVFIFHLHVLVLGRLTFFITRILVLFHVFLDIWSQGHEQVVMTMCA